MSLGYEAIVGTPEEVAADVHGVVLDHCRDCGAPLQAMRVDHQGQVWASCVACGRLWREVGLWEGWE